ncbi:MAG TPA: DUF2325 domain-containing protein [Bacillota bacterium]
MNIVIYGGDRLGKIPLLLKNHGFNLVKHVTGRKHSDLKTNIPSHVSTVLVLTDYLSHSMLSDVKTTAKRKGLKTVFAKRSWSEIQKVIQL